MAAGLRDQTAAPRSEMTSDHELVKKTICRLMRERGLTPLHIAVTGSRAKGLASTQSDYDTKVITMAEQRDYMLQRVKPAFSFSEMVDGQEIEGTATDVLTAIQHVASGNPWSYEIFTGVPLLTSDLAGALKETWEQTYSAARMQVSLRGILMGYKFKTNKIGCGATSTTAKKAAEAAYLATKLHWLGLQPKTAPPPVNAFELLDSHAVRPQDREWIAELFQQRTQDKEAEVRLTPEFWALVDEALEVEVPQTEEDASRSGMEVARQNLETVFLQMFE